MQGNGYEEKIKKPLPRGARGLGVDKKWG